MDFHKLTLKDKETLDHAFALDPRPACDFCFAINYLWRDVYNIELATEGNFALMRYSHDGIPSYSFPLGDPADKEGFKAALTKLTEDSKSRNEVLRLYPVLDSDCSRLSEALPGRFRFEETRDFADYIYDREKLATLSGKKLHGKRNHIARFLDEPDWQYEEISASNADECIELDHQWFEAQGDGYSEAIIEEQSAVHFSLRKLKELGLSGGLIRRKGEVIAFAVGEPLTKDTYVVHIEKARADIQGAYQMINREFVRHNCMDYKYVNREDDAGDPGLRKAKLSYYPEILLRKFEAVLIQ